jgi:hypothetical protein
MYRSRIAGIAASTVLCLSACSGENDPGNSSSAGTGSSGSAGSAGSSGMSGSAGESGSSGNAGNAGSATGGSAGSSGGTAGATGTGGSAGTDGSAGSAGTGTGGSAGNGPGPHNCDVVSSSKPCTTDPDPCGLNSGYEGDEYCILPPPTDKGIQIHFGPKDYKNLDEVRPYLLPPGGESNSYGIAHIPLTENRWYNRVEIRMRPGSHHLINSLVQGKPAEGFLPAGSSCPSEIAGFAGTQNLVYNSMPNGIPAPENVGLGSSLAANTSLCLNHHGYNISGTTQRLREVWINVYFVPESEVTQRSTGVFVIAGPWQGIPPHTRQALTMTATASGNGRFLSLFGHRHAHTERFAVWQNDNLIYDSWDWQESVVYTYNSITTNPSLAPDKKKDGALSGIVEIKAGDKIKIQCDVNNTSENTLTFRNEVMTGEMCILFGSTVGATVRGGTGSAP